MFGVCAVLSSAYAQEDEGFGDATGPVAEEPSAAPVPTPRAKSAKTKKISSGVVRAIVITDGAAVYQRPDFDSPVLGYLNFETIVTVSKKAAIGVGGLGIFHKTKMQGKFGYLADTDIRVSRKDSGSAAAVKTAKKKKSKSKVWDDDEEDDSGPGQKDPIYFTRYLGGALASVNFTEKFSGRNLSDQMLMYGIRMTGPGVLFDGPPVDFNLWFSMDKPGYYQKFTSKTPTGFLVFGDAMLMMPLKDEKNWCINYGVGIMGVYTRYKVAVKNSSFDSQEFRLGADFGLGGAYRINQYAIRADVKYYYEKTQYMGFVGSFQTEF